MEYNFYKIDTLNQGTPYDYNSVMQYEKYDSSFLCVYFDSLIHVLPHL